MARDYKKLKLEQTEELLRPFRRLSRAQSPRGGWVRAIREALGMSGAQLAARLNVTRQTIKDLEHSEANGKITLESLNKLATALGCRVVYVLCPEKPLEDMQRDRAREIAESLMKPVSHSMKLEAQAIGEREEQRQRERIVQGLLQGNPKKLWQ
ncbi:MAG TPA: mobile mystery protein A [Burkholderiales bacterium]|jgi:predicted DNA-binding mobile mystery protein A